MGEMNSREYCHCMGLLMSCTDDLQGKIWLVRLPDDSLVTSSGTMVLGVTKWDVDSKYSTNHLSTLDRTVTPIQVPSAGKTISTYYYWLIWIDT